MYRAAQRMNLNTVGKAADREAFLGLVRDLEGAGCVEVRGAGLAASYGVLCVTEEGLRQLGAPQEPPRASATATEQPGRERGLSRSVEGAQRLWWRRVFGG
jgi:hypothetical protein